MNSQLHCIFQKIMHLSVLYLKDFPSLTDQYKSDASLLENHYPFL